MPPKTDSDLSVHQLRCEYSIDPLGVGEAKPRLSWKLSAADKTKILRGLNQSAYQIIASNDVATIRSGIGDLWDSGRVDSSETIFIEYTGPALRSRQRVWWTVRVWDQNGRASDWPAPAFFEMGLLNRADWTAKWIGSHMVGGRNAEVPAPFFRKEFSLSAGKQIARARLYATALGVYEFHINGQRVGRDVFSPGWTDYRKRVQYQVYDVTDLLKCNTQRDSAQHVAGAILGDGWYSGYIGNINRRQLYGDRPRMLAQLVIDFSDGTSQTIATDESWKTAAGPIIASDMLMGESYDARLEMPGWDVVGFVEDARWAVPVIFDDPGIERVAMQGPPVRAVKEIAPISEPKKISHGWGASNYIFDLGQNMVGRIRLKVKGDAGATVTMKFAEVLDKNGRIYTANLRQARQTDHYTLRGDPQGETYESLFTFHGFRYVELTNFPGTPDAQTVTGIVLHSDMEQIGTFECSEPLVNQLQHNIEWGQRGNFVDIPTDCPQRDERLGWTGDAQVFIRTAAFNFDVSGFFAKWTQDLRDAQGELGAYPSVVPNTEAVRNDGKAEWGADGGPAWADAGIICPWTMHLCQGDRRLIERHYDSMAKFVARLRQSGEPFGLIRAHPDYVGWHGFGDWLSQDGKEGLMGNTPKELIGTAFLAHDARLMSGMAGMLGKNDDMQRYARLADEVAAVFCRRFVTPDGLIVGNSQTAYVLALHFNLLPQAQRATAADALVRDIKRNGTRLSTGFVGSPYLNHVLTRAGRLDVAYELLMQKNWPSWLYSVTQGATTIWERWDGWTQEKGFQDAGMNSFNHYAYGAVGDWLYQIVAGLDVDLAHPGYARLILHPHPKAHGPLKYASATLETLRGKIESGWKIDADGLSLQYDVRVPPNVTATAFIPAADPSAVTESGKALDQSEGVKVLQPEKARAVVEIGSGTYRFESKLPT